MATDSESNLQLEIGHVLFIDIVGYSKLLIDEQRIAHVLLGLSLLKKGDTAGAIAELQKTKTPDPGAWYQGFLGYAFAISGDRAKAGQALSELEELAKKQYVSPTAFATIYLGLGEKEKTLDWLKKGYEERDSACWYLKIDQIYNGVRNEPRFQAILKEVGLDK